MNKKQLMYIIDMLPNIDMHITIWKEGYEHPLYNSLKTKNTWKIIEKQDEGEYSILLGKSYMSECDWIDEKKVKNIIKI